MKSDGGSWLESCVSVNTDGESWLVPFVSVNSEGKSCIGNSIRFQLE